MSTGAEIRLDDRGLMPAMVLHAETGEPLMLAFMNAEAYARTLAGPHVWFYSRSRGELWEKGSTSGNYLRFVSAKLDCDRDAIVVRALPAGPACHTGAATCFHHDPSSEPEFRRRMGPGILAELSEVIRCRAAEMPEGSYTAELLRSGVPRVAQKVIEEAGETALAAATGGGNTAEELADLLYHALVLLRAADVSIDEVWRELEKRRG